MKNKKKSNPLRSWFRKLLFMKLSNSEKRELFFLLVALYLGTIASSLMPQLSLTEPLPNIFWLAFLSWISAIFILGFGVLVIFIVLALLIDLIKKVWAVLIELSKLGQANPQTQTRS